MKYLRNLIENKNVQRKLEKKGVVPCNNRQWSLAITSFSLAKTIISTHSTTENQ
jgi:hypothetical protein